MSTKPQRPNPAPRVALAALLAALAAACTAPQTGRPVRAFSEIGPGRPPPASPDALPSDIAEPGPQSPHYAATAHILAPPMRLRPPLAAPPEPSPVLPGTVGGAAGRVAAWLEHAGFAVEQRPEGAGERLAATRMGAPSALEGEAICGLEAMRRPDISSTDVDVTLTPAPGGVQVETSARFVEIDTRLLSGELSRQTCRSRGLLEAAVRRAALGG